jgi:hypothetical protein
MNDGRYTGKEGTVEVPAEICGYILDTRLPF